MNRDEKHAPSVLMILLEAPGFPPDIRVEKEIAVLQAAGWFVTVLALNEGGQKERETFGFRGEIIRIRPLSRSKLRSAFFYLFPTDGRLSAKIASIVEDVKPAIVHVHDLVYAGVVVRALRRTNVRLILDLHENMPAAFVAYRRAFVWWKRIALAIIQNRSCWKVFERRWFRRADRVLLVVQEAMKRFAHVDGAKEKIVIVGNTESVDTLPESEAVKWKETGQDPIVLLYIGGVGPHRGVNTVLHGLALSKNRAKFVVRVVGLRPAQQELLLRTINTLNIQDNVKLHTWVPKELVAKEIVNSDWGLVPHAWTEHTNTTVPHKLYQYMILGRPVIVSSCPPLRRIVQEHNAGLVFRADDAKSFAFALDQVANDPDMAQRFGRSARSACLGPLSWSLDAERLINTYKELIT